MKPLKIIFKFKVKFDTVLCCWRCKAKIKPGEFAFVLQRLTETDVRRGFIWDNACVDELEDSRAK
jgi:hypothetical protein